MGTRREFYNVILCLISYISIKLSEVKSDSRIPWTEEPGELQSIGSQRVGHDWSNLACELIIREMKLIMTRHRLVLFEDTRNKKDEYSENTGSVQFSRSVMSDSLWPHEL